MIFLAILSSSCRNYLGHADNYFPPIRSRRRRTSSPIGISGHLTRFRRAVHGRFHPRAKLWAFWRCSARSCCFSSALGSTSRRSARELPADLPDLFLGPYGDIAVLASAAAAGGRALRVISQIATMYYFAHFLIILPLLSMVEKRGPCAPIPLPRACCMARRPNRPDRRRCRPRRGPRPHKGRDAHGPHPRFPRRSRFRRRRPPGRCSGRGRAFERRPPHSVRISSTSSRATFRSASPGRSVGSIGSSCSAASRSTATSARAAMASTWSRSATCTISAIPRRRCARSPTSGRSRSPR